MNITLKCFASFKEKLGLEEERLALPASVNTVGDLVTLLIEQRGEAWKLLSASNTLVAVNHEMSNAATELQEGDEVAFFPPVTGG